MILHTSGEQEVAGDRVIEPSPAVVAAPPAPESGTSTSGSSNLTVQIPAPAPLSGETSPIARPSIDQMIEQLQREQDQRLASTGQEPLSSPTHTPNTAPQLGSPRPRPGPSRSNSGTAIFL